MEDAEKFKDMMELESVGGEMKETDIYYYRARLIIKKNVLPVIFKSDYPSYLFGDCIKKRLSTGLVLKLRILEKLGTDKPAPADYLCFPQIISEI